MEYMKLAANSDPWDYDGRAVTRYFQPLVVSVALVTCVINIIIFARLHATTLHTSSLGQEVYSPAMGVFKVEPRVFMGGFGLNSTIYSGFPSEQNNKHWTDLYNFGISRLSSQEARPLVNRTLPIPGDEDHYIVSLSVFHQLHCLNRVRLAVYGEIDWTDVDDSIGITHIDHCINAIRQSLMCNVDITPLTWRHDSNGRAKEIMEVVHSCKNFEAVQEWGMDRVLLNDFDFDAVVEDDPLGWGTYGLD